MHHVSITGRALCIPKVLIIRWHSIALYTNVVAFVSIWKPCTPSYVQSDSARGIRAFQKRSIFSFALMVWTGTRGLAIFSVVGLPSVLCSICCRRLLRLFLSFRLFSFRIFSGCNGIDVGGRIGSRLYSSWLYGNRLCYASITSGSTSRTIIRSKELFASARL